MALSDEWCNEGTEYYCALGAFGPPVMDGVPSVDTEINIFDHWVVDKDE